jgi:hypothetical protein
LAGPCLAGWFAEVQPQPRLVHNTSRTGVSFLPPLIELGGLEGLGEVELVVLDASHRISRQGWILNVLRLAGDQAVRLALGAPWPEDVELPIQSEPLAVGLPATEFFSLDLRGPRSLLLFADRTGLTPNSGRIQDQKIDLPWVGLLDALSFGFAGDRASPLSSEIVLELIDQGVIARPRVAEWEVGPALYLTGVPDVEGYLHGYAPPFRLNPGVMNEVWEPQAVPAPGVLVLMGVGWKGWWWARCFVRGR